ncbi:MULTISPECIES: nitronate monooxygenase family protein [Myxococcaceae]|uniref:NAD(P)H-dependent flavin oxidoreductase n=1 Tax=Myxococcaceae TaxID=31 RepID=UPI00188F623A|nr:MULTISPECIES: nitronate monooxygenase [Myxococcaceae]MBF5045179.1 nitronate monooxygenase [Simulacricoccus sp. 17bor-14]
MPVLHTPLCDLLGLRVPLLQSGMLRVAGPALVAEVSRAGGLGILAGLSLPPDTLRAQIREVRRLTDRPFGVNLWLHPLVRAPTPPAQLPAQEVQRVQGKLNAFRAELGLQPVQGPPPPAPPAYIDEDFEVLVEERVPVWSVGLGVPSAAQVERCHAAGIKVVGMAASVADARTLEAAGVDVLVAQGSEAGGHRSTWTGGTPHERALVGTLALVPAMVDAVRVPVVAAGGITDGRGLVASLALGASGVLLGTRFVATRESEAPDLWKQALLARGADDTVLTRMASGLWGRALRNPLAEAFGADGIAGLSGYGQRGAIQDIVKEATARGDAEHFPLFGGQGVGLMHDVPGAGEVVERMVAEAQAVLARLR